MSAEEARLAKAAREAALPLDGSAHEHDDLLDGIGEARFVLLGQATHERAAKPQPEPAETFPSAL